MMTPKIFNQIRKVSLHYYNCLDGLRFFDANDNPIFEVGLTQGLVTTVEIGAAE